MKNLALVLCAFTFMGDFLVGNVEAKAEHRYRCSLKYKGDQANATEETVYSLLFLDIISINKRQNISHFLWKRPGADGLLKDEILKFQFNVGKNDISRFNGHRSLRPRHTTRRIRVTQQFDGYVKTLIDREVYFPDYSPSAYYILNQVKVDGPLNVKLIEPETSSEFQKDSQKKASEYQFECLNEA